MTTEELVEVLKTSIINNFHTYGFVGDFEGEILKEVDGIFVGYFIKDGHIIGCSWGRKGSNRVDNEFNITPIKKEWHDNPDNFPCWIIDNNGDINTIEKAYSLKGADYYSKNCDTSYHGGYYRLATKEEVMSIYCEEE